jgi:class 3 adenylate cyclase
VEARLSDSRPPEPAPHAAAASGEGAGKSSVVTIMHLDVKGSTALTTRVGDDVAREVMTATKQIARERAEAAGGRLIDAVGDAMMLTFTSTRSAILAATSIQDAFAEREREEPGSTLSVRIGLNVGEVIGHDATPFGAAVNAGARGRGWTEGTRNPRHL